MQRNSTPLIWRPKGVSDTLDASSAFNGAMAILQNLIPDPTTAMLWQCRPAALKKADFVAGGFSSPGFVSLIDTSVSGFVYGTVATSRFPGYDEPFCFNLNTGAFVSVAGVDMTNVPRSPLEFGAWDPPDSSLIGSKLIVTHPGFTGANGVFFGWFDVTAPGTPVWHGSNLTGNVQFVVAPSQVQQFNQRAYYITNDTRQPAVIYSDVLNATNVTNANQVLTFGDTEKLTALGPLSFYNQLGGIIQALMVFKGNINVYQVLGDAALNNLSVNTLNISTGTQAARTVCTTPQGLAFVSPQGLRLIDFNARMSEPIGNDGQGVVAPFIYANVPSRMVAGCVGDVIRITTQNVSVPGAPWQEFWYDFARKIWSGPHTFPAVNMVPSQGTFLMTPVNVHASIWQSDVVQNATSTFTENGIQLSFDWRTSFLPDTEKMTENCITETTLNVQTAAGSADFVVKALNQNATVLDTFDIVSTGVATVWGQFVWGQAVWGGTPNFLVPRQVNWHLPLVFCRIQFDVTGPSSASVKIGTLSLRYQILRYLSNVLAAVA